MAAIEQVVAQDVLDGVGGGDKTIVTPGGVGTLTDVFLKLIEPPFVNTPTKQGVIEQLCTGFQVTETGELAKGKVALVGVDQVKDEQLVPARCDLFKTVGDGLGVAVKIAELHDQPTPLESQRKSL